MDIQNAITLLEKNERIGILLGEKPSFDCLATGEVLSHILRERGKMVGSLDRLSFPSEAHPFPSIASLSPLPKEFIVSMDTIASPVSELRYERHENKIDVVFSPKTKEIEERSLSFRKGRMLCDCAITIGINNVESITLPEDIYPEFLSETPLVNIDTSEENTQYGEANLIDHAKGSRAEIGYALIATMGGELLSQKSATLLLAGIMSETGWLRAPKTSADTLLASSELMRLGANLDEASQLLRKEKPLSLLQLIGRASVRSKIEDAKKILWSFLTAEDFEKTGRNFQDLSEVLTYFAATLPPHVVSVLLWQDQKERLVHAYLGGGYELLSAIKLRAPATFQSPHLSLDASFANFREAESHIHALLDEVL